MNTTSSPASVGRQRLYKIWLSYMTSDSTEGRKEIQCEVIASEAARAIQAVLSQHQGIDVVVATIEQVASLDEAIVASD